MKIDNYSSNEAVLKEMGKRIKKSRINAGYTQAELADISGVSLKTISLAEQGNDMKFGNVLKILRALDMLENIDAILPEVIVRPSEIRSYGKERERVRKTSVRSQDDSTWKWGDER